MIRKNHTHKMATRHVAIDNWLNALNMAEYSHLFQSYNGVEELLYASESDINEIGIQNEGHRLKVMSSLRILRGKQENGRQVPGSGLVSPSRAVASLPSAPNSPSSPCYPDFQFSLVSPEKLQADLQRELSGDPSDLRTREWYHGNITRHKAESLVTNNGDFLIRDCISQPGDFVLTCRWNDSPLSFIINSIIKPCIPGTLPTISYQFEEETFPTIHQLIQHYQEHHKPVTAASQAILKSPIPRLIPLSYYDSKYGALINLPVSSYATPNQSPVSTPFVTPFTSPQTSPNMNRRTLDHKSNTKSNIPIDVSNKPTRPTSLDNLPIINITPPEHLPAPPNQNGPASSKPVTTHVRADSAPAFISESLPSHTELFQLPTTPLPTKISPTTPQSDPTTPPPKPSRVPSIKAKQNPEHLANKILQGNNRFSDYHQEKDNVTCFNGCVESPSKFIEEILRHLSPLSSDRSERGRSPDNFNREDKSQHNQIDGLNNKSNKFKKCRSVSPVPSAHTLSPDQSTQSHNHQNIARSKSFNCQKNMDEICDRQSGSIIEDSKPPSISSRCKAVFSSSVRLLLPENENNNNNNNSNHFPKEKVTADLDKPKNHYANIPPPPRITAPPTLWRSNINLDNFSSRLFQSDHKAFDKTILFNAKSTLLTKSPKDIALHLTKYDLKLMSALHDSDLGLGVTSGLELITLPQGKQLRQDVIERWESLRLFTLASLLTQSAVDERASTLSMWVQVCLELRDTTGNLFSFTAIMEALNNQCVRQLTSTWVNLRQNFTTSAVFFDTKLRPSLISLNYASAEVSLTNICVPYVTPVCRLLEGDLEAVLDGFHWESDLDPIANAIDVFLNHLDVARFIASQGSACRVSGKELTSSMNFDPELSQILCPEFHLLLLWGRRCLSVARQDRLDKMEQIFGLLSLKCLASEGEVGCR